MGKETKVVSYSTPAATSHPPKKLVSEGDVDASFVFYDRIEIGRHREGAEASGVLLIKDQTVSSRHCIITQEPDGRCYVRDTSRNGTRLDGRRLSPNLKTEVKVGQVLSVGMEQNLRLEGEHPTQPEAVQTGSIGTLGVSQPTSVTVVVADIRDYTVLVQRAPSSALQESVGRVFGRLEKAVVELGGTLKEYQGDALFAFWEEDATGSHAVGSHAVGACRAALNLHRLAQELAEDRSVWQVEDFPLRMDWALATGPVVITGYGDENALGLSMVGESVVLAFRIEKFADEATGSIVVCPVTRKMASKSFKFKNLGLRKAKGFDAPQRLYSLVSEKKRRGDS
jgi:class 3 adenylate cyclase